MSSEVIAFIQLYGWGLNFNRNEPDSLECTEIDCRNNHLTSIPDLSTLTNLQKLWCQTNQLTELPPETLRVSKVAA
jgi:Leucine-rich repeat (LRR) protein